MYQSRDRIPPRSTGNALRLLDRFRKADSGATALEFGLVATPFLILMIAIMEVALVYFANFSMENAVDQAGRLVRTGQAQQQGFSQSQFKQSICDKVAGLGDCMGGLKVEVKKFNNFGGISLDDPLTGEGALRDDFGYDPGAGGDVVVVRAFYEWNLTSAIPGTLGNMANGSRLIAAVATFRNEPFDN